jgi:biopolymer transport protein ExbD
MGAKKKSYDPLHPTVEDEGKEEDKETPQVATQESGQLSLKQQQKLYNELEDQFVKSTTRSQTAGRFGLGMESHKDDS